MVPIKLKSVGFLRINVLKKGQSKNQWKTGGELKGVCFEEQLKHKKIKRDKIIEAAGK